MKTVLIGFLTFVLLATLSRQANNVPAPAVPEKETVLEMSEDGAVSFAKVPQGSNVHVIVAEGKLIGVRLQDTQVSFQ